MFQTYRMQFATIHKSLVQNVSTQINKTSTTYFNSLDKISHYTNLIKQRIRAVEIEVNKTKNSYKMYLNGCPKNWSVYGYFIQLYICYKN